MIAIGLVYVNKDELSFYVIFSNFYIVLPIFSTVIDVNYAIVAVYFTLLVNAYLTVTDRRALIIVSVGGLISFVIFALIIIYAPRDAILTLPRLDLILTFVVILSMLNTMRQFNAERLNRTQELDDKNEELERYIESNLELENFAFIASHDLKTPIRNIISFSQLLRAKTGERLKPKEKEYLDMIIRSSKNMNQLISDILKYSKSDTVDYQVRKIYLKPFLDQITKELSHEIQEKSADVVILVHPDHIIYGDESMLHHVFLNLLTNALTYCDESKPPTVTVHSEVVKEDMIISVVDNGIGIAPEYREMVFLLFKRLHNQMEFSGTGIGLSIAKKVVSKHKGKIWIESNPKGGSVFKVALPKATVKA